MKQNIYKVIFSSILLSGCALPVYSQLHESITVEAEYLPAIRQHERQGATPAYTPTALPAASLPIDTKTGGTTPDAIYGPMTDSGWMTRLYKPQWAGYADLRLGSYLDASASLGYRFINDDATKAGAWLQYDGSSLFRPELSVFSLDKEKADYRRRYDGTLGIYGSHRFDGAGTLSADLSYHLGYFNYYTSLPVKPTYQTLNDLLFNASWTGKTDTERLENGFGYNADISFRHFAFRTDKSGRQNDASIHAGAFYGFNRNSKAFLDATARLLATSGRDTYTQVTLTPAWEGGNSGFTARLGMNLDFTSMPKPLMYDKFSTFHLSPDVALSYATGRFTAALKARGGVAPATLQWLHELDYYCAPVAPDINPMYTPLDAMLNLKFGSFSGFSVEVFGGYRISRNMPFAGWYPYLADPHLTVEELSFLSLSPYSSMNIKGMTVGASVSYSLSSLLRVSATGSYQPQNHEYGYFNGFDRPRWLLDMEACLRPVSGLDIKVSYVYRGVRNLYLNHAADTDMLPNLNPWTPEPLDVTTVRLKDIYNLGVSAAYTFLDRYTLGVEVSNILGCDMGLNPLQPSEGIVAAGRVAVLF